MRELTKSVLSFTWSLSVFGLAQAANVLTSRRAGHAFEDVTRTTEEQLGPWARPLFNAGDRVQRGLVDLTFRTLGLDLFGRSSCSGCRQSGQCSCSRCERQRSGQDSGWGPIPPPRGS